MKNKEELHQDIINYIKENYGSNEIEININDVLTPDYLDEYIDKDYITCLDMEYGINTNAFNIILDDVCTVFENDDDFIIDEVEDLILNNFNITTNLNDSIVCIAIIVNHGDMNYDYSLHDILHYTNEKLRKEAGLYWLATQQKKNGRLLKAIKTLDHKTSDNFVNTCVEELINLPYGSHSALTICTQIKWEDLIKLKKEIESFEDSEYRYSPTKCRTGRFCDNKITISKNAIVGLFDYMAGGGSTMEIEVDKDIKIPIQFIHKVMPFFGKSCTGYTPDEVYGFCYDALIKTKSTINF